MHPEAPSLLQRKLDRLVEDHVGDLAAVTMHAIDVLDVSRPGSIAQAFEQFKTEVATRLSDHLGRIRQAAVSAAQDAGQNFGRVDKDALEAIVLERLPRETLYPERFDGLCDAIKRWFAHTSRTIQKEPFRADLTRSLVHAGAANALSRMQRDLSNDLETLVQRNEAQATAPVPDTALDQFNKTVKLAPSFMGLSVDLNYLLKRLFHPRNKD